MACSTGMSKKTMYWQWKLFFYTMSPFDVIYDWSCKKMIKVTAHAFRDGKCDVTISSGFLQLQTLIITANRDMAQKNSFYYHNPVFMLNLKLVPVEVSIYEWRNNHHLYYLYLLLEKRILWKGGKTWYSNNYSRYVPSIFICSTYAKVCLLCG